MSNAPEMKKVRARDVVPYEWGIWCTVEGDPKPFVNSIEQVRWSDDGQHLWFMLGTHNFHKALPDEELELVPCERAGDAPWRVKMQEDARREHAKTIAARPVPVTKCVACDGSGHVADQTGGVEK